MFQIYILSIIIKGKTKKNLPNAETKIIERNSNIFSRVLYIIYLIAIFSVTLSSVIWTFYFFSLTFQYQTRQIVPIVVDRRIM